MATLFTSDLHLGHTNIIKYCNRPFKNVEEMDETIINNWNSKVSQNDTIWVLGDFSFYRNEKNSWILSRLKGEKHLVIGNHDKKNKARKAVGWVSTQNEITIEVNNKKLYLCHYYHEQWKDKWLDQDIHLHGHSHGTSEAVLNRYDVGVDVWDFSPVTLEEIINGK